MSFESYEYFVITAGKNVLKLLFVYKWLETSTNKEGTFNIHFFFTIVGSRIVSSYLTFVHIDLP